jgi:hypothetical protein
MRNEGAHRFFSISEKRPDPNDVVIVERTDGKKDQVNIRDGYAYEWRYEVTDRIFCPESEIKEWRGCTGFDF